MSAAQSTSWSVTPPSFTSTSASAIGWLMYGEASASFLRWSRCLCAANASALRSSASSPFVFAQAIWDEGPCHDGDCGIGHVERRPVVTAGMEIEEVDHLPE